MHMGVGGVVQRKWQRALQDRNWQSSLSGEEQVEEARKTLPPVKSTPSCGSAQKQQVGKGH